MVRRESMARDNSRLTHAQYHNYKFLSDNSGPYSLPNGADQRFIDVVNSIPEFNAMFYEIEGDVMVSHTARRLGNEGVPEALSVIAERFGMVETDNYSSPNTVTFEYSPDA